MPRRELIVPYRPAAKGIQYLMGIVQGVGQDATNCLGSYFGERKMMLLNVEESCQL